MFGKLREALSDLRRALSTKELSEEEVSAALEDLKWRLIEGEVALDAAEGLARDLRGALLGAKVRRGHQEEDVSSLVRGVLLSWLRPLEAPPLEEGVRRARPYVAVFLGINGGGKTTTIAKVAYALKRSGLRPIIAAADTFRAGAIEQLSLHAQRIGVEVVSQGYGADPAAVARDAVERAASRRYDAVLVDTAGRMYTKSHLMDELRKIVEVSGAHERIMIVDALTGNDAVSQAKEFDAAVGVDSVIVTKVDADVRGGVVLTLAYELRRPIRYLGVGQGYEDLRPFSAEALVGELLGGRVRWDVAAGGPPPRA
ncbi:MAG: signal recognition particle-docking protein FtsY [Thaumarchaeota archaeon]|jgi:fused signal recognition particle receptor|nr:signal recognition particle-docking protein FtsY [Nitrososphaerota archaeon]